MFVCSFSMAFVRCLVCFNHSRLIGSTDRNAQNTFLKLLDMGIVPIVNENDTVREPSCSAADGEFVAIALCT